MTKPNKLKAQFGEGAAWFIHDFPSWFDRRKIKKVCWKIDHADKRRSRSRRRRQARWERDNDPQWYTTHRIDMEAVLGRRMGAGYFE